MVSPTDIADAFDRIDDENRRDLERALKKRGQNAANEYGIDDWRTIGIAVHSGLLEAGYIFLAMQGRALVDVLRLGETLKKPSAGAAFRDTLRILQIVPMLGAGAKLARTGLANLAASGGEMSCVITGNTFALRMSGRSLFVTLEELWRGANLPFTGRTLEELALWLDPLGKISGNALGWRFPGLQNMDALVPQVEALGGSGTVAVKVMGGVNNSLNDVRALATTGRGPVPFGVTWWGRPQGSTVVQPVGRHMMVMYKNWLGQMAIADQTGTRTLSSFLAQGNQFSVEGYYLVENARWLTDLELVSRYAVAGRLYGGLVPNPGPSPPAFPPPLSVTKTDVAFMAQRLQMPMYHVPGPIAVRWDTELRRKLGRPPRKPLHAQPHGQPKPPVKPYLWDDPNLEGAEPDVRTLWAAIRANGGGHGQILDENAIRNATRLETMAFETAMMELELLYRRVHVFSPLMQEAGGRRVEILWP